MQTEYSFTQASWLEAAGTWNVMTAATATGRSAIAFIGDPSLRPLGAASRHRRETMGRASRLHPLSARMVKARALNLHERTRHPVGGERKKSKARHEAGLCRTRWSVLRSEAGRIRIAEQLGADIRIRIRDDVAAAAGHDLRSAHPAAADVGSHGVVGDGAPMLWAANAGEASAARRWPTRRSRAKVFFICLHLQQSSPLPRTYGASRGRKCRRTHGRHADFRNNYRCLMRLILRAEARIPEQNRWRMTPAKTVPAQFAGVAINKR